MSRLRKDERVLLVKGNLILIGLGMNEKRYRKLVNSQPILKERFAVWKRVATLEDANQIRPDDGHKPEKEKDL